MSDVFIDLVGADSTELLCFLPEGVLLRIGFAHRENPAENYATTS